MDTNAYVLLSIVAAIWSPLSTQVTPSRNYPSSRGRLCAASICNPDRRKRIRRIHHIISQGRTGHTLHSLSNSTLGAGIACFMVRCLC
ncbi:hypothetical protein F5Y15DRAFT_391682 [Xylariaceae sp. FL0016]|nr:hypothetical protein F5Y15DRAFT_391682 [Xylariaceae sp. FL0016]